MADQLDPNLLQKGAAFYHTYVETVSKAAPTSFIQSMMNGHPDWTAGTKFADHSYRTGVALVRGLTARESARCVAAIAKDDLEGALAVASSTLFCGRAIELFGSEDQKRKWLPQEPGGAKLGAYAMSEPDAGSDASMIATKVRLQGNDLVLAGKKACVANGEGAHFLIVFATGAGNADEERSKLSAFIVSANKKGVVKTPRVVAGVHVADIAFEDVRLSRDDMIGTAGQGYAVAQAGFDHLRLAAAAACAAAARSIFEKALEEAKTRHQFGKVLIELDMVAEKIVAMTEAVEAMDAFVAFTASMADEGRDFSAEAAAARIFCARTAIEVAEEALQIAGSRGLDAESPFARTLQSLRAFRFVGGADEVLKLFVVLYGARPAAEYILAAKKGSSGAGAFDAVIKLWWKGFRLSLTRPKRRTSQPKLVDAARACGEAAGILSERVHTVFDYYGAEAAEHEYELRRIADMAIEIAALHAATIRAEHVLRGTIEGDKDVASAAPNWRARRAWKRLAAWSSEIFLADDLEMDKLIEKHAPPQA